MTAADPSPNADGDLADPDELALMLELLTDALELNPPEFGSPAWIALPDSDPKREASMLVGAWCAWAARLGLAAPVAPEQLEQVVERELKAVAVALSDTADWTTIAQHSRYVDAMRRRRDELPAARPGDHRGGAVAAWGPGTGRPAA